MNNNTAIRRLPDSELEVMQAVWDCTPPASKDDVKGQITARPMAETTLLTLLSRLADKGFLRVEMEKRRKFYTPQVTRQEYLAAQSRRFLDQLCQGSMSAFASALCGGGLTKEEVRQLRELLERDEL